MGNEVIIIYYSLTNELYHHGVKGMRWGVRRYRNTDGSITAAGKKHYQTRNRSEESKRKIDARKVVAMAGVLTIAAATAYVASNPKARAAVVKAAKSLGKVTSQKTKVCAEKGKHYLKRAGQEFRAGLREGVREGIHNAPKKAVSTIVTGAGLYAGKKILDQMIGKDDSGRVFRANDKKKIGSFWTYTEKEDDED